MITITPNNVSTGQLHGYLLGAIGPRPIAFASTIGKNGIPNLAPFSFFNVFSANPPILIFSPARRVRDNTTKHTLENVIATKEVVINIVNYNMVQQMSLASTEYDQQTNEFIKAGLTMVESSVVKPFRVAESPVQIECKVTKVEALGENGGAGNLVFCEVVKLHISPKILDENGAVDPSQIDLVARMGGNWYSRAKEGLFMVPKPLSTLGMGVDAIPDHIKNSNVLTGNDLGLLGNVEKLPTPTEIKSFLENKAALIQLIADKNTLAVHRQAHNYLVKGDVTAAWMILLAKV